MSFLLASVFVYSQITFQKHYGGNGMDIGRDVLQTPDGGYIISGYTNNINGTGYIIRTNENGDTLWTRTYGGNLSQDFNSIKMTYDSCYIVCGQTHGLGFYGCNVLLMKLNKDGDTLWQKGYGGYGDEEADDVIQTSDSGFALVGVTMSFGNAITSEYLIKTNKNGDTLWTKIYEKYSDNWGKSLIQLNDKGYLIAGKTGSNVSNLDIYLVRTNQFGDTLWTKTIGGSLFEDAGSVIKTNDSGFLITGTTNSLGDGGYDVFVVNTDSNGLIKWTKTYGGINDDAGDAGIQTSDGGYAIVGTTQSFGSGITDIYLLKLNQNGDTLWTRTFGGTGMEGPGAIKETADGGLVIVGTTESFGGNDDVFLIKTDANGHFVGIDDYTSSMNNRITIYPNPTTGQAKIQIQKNFGQTKTLEIFDYTGQLQLTKTGNFSDIDISSLTNGLYFIVLTNKDNERQTIKIIKN